MLSCGRCGGTRNGDNGSGFNEFPSSFVTSNENALQGSKPLGKRFLIGSAKAVCLLLNDNLKTRRFRSGHRVNLCGVDDLGHRNYPEGRVLAVIFVEGKTFPTKDDPEFLPLANPSLALEAV
jgi:hypothetical protein